MKSPNLTLKILPLHMRSHAHSGSKCVVSEIGQNLYSVSGRRQSQPFGRARDGGPQRIIHNSILNEICIFLVLI
jgi:hypothetical protein